MYIREGAESQPWHKQSGLELGSTKVKKGMGGPAHRHSVRDSAELPICKLVTYGVVPCARKGK